MPEGQQAGRVAIVTGAARGIGRAIAERLWRTATASPSSIATDPPRTPPRRSSARMRWR